MTICAATDCQHGSICHQYQTITSANSGECLAPNCPCGEFSQPTKETS